MRHGFSGSLRFLLPCNNVIEFLPPTAPHSTTKSCTILKPPYIQQYNRQRTCKMAQNSKIEWTEVTWNPVSGCTKISAGCKNCYAERMAKRLKAMGMPQYRNGFKVSLHPKSLTEPLRFRKPRIIFVCSMGDLFHTEVLLAFIKKVFSVMNQCDSHIFQVLTKRPHLAARYASKLNWTDNIWLGTTVENQDTISRIQHLRKIPAKVRFISAEPLLDKLPRLPLTGVHWVIVGGESGPRARPIKAEWVREIRDRCIKYNVPFFFKQWGGFHKSRNGRLLDGRIWDEMPH